MKQTLTARWSAVLALCAGTCVSTAVLAAEVQASADAAAAPYTTDMDAPGRSSVPAPAFPRAPRLEHRSDFSPQDMAFELRFGPYAPRVNESADAPVGDLFFGDKTRYQFGFELDGQLWRAPHVGSLGVGAGWGYTRLGGRNQLPLGMESTEEISQKSTLNIMPMYAVGVLRVDVLAREFHIPFVAYGKFGLGYALWWVNNGRGTAKTNCDENGKHCLVGRDASVGTQAALGAMFLLDWLEPSAGAELDSAMGINNSYLFLEWSVSNFGGDQMNVGTNTWVTGLAVEM